MNDKCMLYTVFRRLHFYQNFLKYSPQGRSQIKSMFGSKRNSMGVAPHYVDNMIGSVAWDGQKLASLKLCDTKALCSARLLSLTQNFGFHLTDRAAKRSQPSDYQQADYQRTHTHAYTRARRYGQNLHHNIFLNFGRYNIIPISIWILKKPANNTHNGWLYLQTSGKWICQEYNNSSYKTIQYFRNINKSK